MTAETLIDLLRQHSCNPVYSPQHMRVNFVGEIPRSLRLSCIRLGNELRELVRLEYLTGVKAALGCPRIAREAGNMAGAESPAESKASQCSASTEASGSAPAISESPSAP